MGDERESKRRNGFLTKTQRAYLRGYSDIESGSQQERDIRREIRDETTGAIRDFSYLMGSVDTGSWLSMPEFPEESDEGLQARDRDQIFIPDEDIKGQFDKGLVDMITFTYLGSVGRVPTFEKILEAGVRRGEKILAESDALDVEVELEITRTTPLDMDLDEVADRVRRKKWDELTEQELRAYLRFFAEAEGEEFDPYLPVEHLDKQLKEYQQQAVKANQKRAESARMVQQRKQKYREDDRTNRE